jgi:hypothetical protein
MRAASVGDWRVAHAPVRELALGNFFFGQLLHLFVTRIALYRRKHCPDGLFGPFKRVAVYRREFCADGVLEAVKQVQDSTLPVGPNL